MRDFKDRSVPDEGTRWLKLRVKLVGAAFLMLLAGAFARAVYLQVFEQAKLKGLAQDQYVREIELPARRGDIFDRRGVPLAQSVEVDSIWIDPSMLDDPRAAAKLIARKLKVDAEELATRFEKSKKFAWVKRQVTPEQVAAVKALGLPGLGFAKEPKRFYPQRELAAQVVGMVGTDGHGLDGLELAFEDELSGEKATVDSLRDAKGRKLLTSGSVDPQDKQGAAVTLTIDRQLQYVTEKALGRAVQDAVGIAGMAVVIQPKTGEILALANWPRFNPNTPHDAKPQQLRDRAALDTFEPGSTFKAFVVAAGLEEHAFSPNDLFDCENGAYAIGRRTIHDTHPHGLLTPQQILKVSSNIGASKLAAKLGREKLVQYYDRFGFGEKTGLGLPGESRGVVPFPKADIQLATESFGQGLTATAVQIAAAYGAIANGGVLMRPYLVAKVVDPDGVVLLENRPTEVRRVISPKTARSVISMLETVTDKDGGTAQLARMDDYRVAGKTGTAQKADPVARGYSDKRIASFIGMVPAEDPQAVILVVIDEPQKDKFGGISAAPAFKEIAQAAMPYLGVPPSVPVPVQVAAAPLPGKGGKIATAAPNSAKNPARPTVAVPESGSELALDEGTDLTEDAESVSEGQVEVPNVQGKVGRDAVVALLGVALEPRLLGSGRVVTQRPAPGERVEKGSRVTLELAARQ